jgi:hypothetical protein
MGKSNAGSRMIDTDNNIVEPLTDEERRILELFAELKKVIHLIPIGSSGFVPNTVDSDKIK